MIPHFPDLALGKWVLDPQKRLTPPSGFVTNPDSWSLRLASQETKMHRNVCVCVRLLKKILTQYISCCVDDKFDNLPLNKIPITPRFLESESLTINKTLKEMDHHG